MYASELRRSLTRHRQALDRAIRALERLRATRRAIHSASAWRTNNIRVLDRSSWSTHLAQPK